MEWLAPWLMPLRQMSGLRCSILSRASFTQSTGVPLHCHDYMPSNSSTLSSLNGVPIVIACPIPDWGLSGATTTICPRSLTASTRACIPGAVMPSSFVIKITGLFSLIFTRLPVSAEQHAPACKIINRTPTYCYNYVRPHTHSLVRYHLLCHTDEWKW